ncbi:MAG TPA: helix-turn-helix domain-containing protein [Baekduia sp.]|jgi:excisionase family DNA binding protein
MHLDPANLEQQLSVLVDEVRRVGRDERLTITIAAEGEHVSPREAGERLGFSRQHVVRLIEAGELAGVKLEGSSYWRIPVRGLVEFEDRRDDARRAADTLSRSLDASGAPLE